MKYRPEIDGLRAIAVLPVVFFHAGFDWFQGGFVGVDVFFVISGYLITSILLEELQQERFSYLSFIERRARRILPVLFVVLFVTTIAAVFIYWPPALTSYSESLFASVTFWSNIYFAETSGYFGQPVETLPLIHTWSLAIEEQFYLLFPWLLVILYRAKVALKWLSIITVLSFLLANLAAHLNASDSFFLIQYRAWELLVGALLALALSRRKYAQVSDRVAGVGLFLIFISVVALDRTTPFPSFYTLPAVIGAALVIANTSTDSVIGTVLSHKIFVWIGLLSYSLYLWHQPLFAFVDEYINDDNSMIISVFVILTSLVFSLISWRWVEQPFKSGGKIRSRQVGSYLGLGFVFLIIVASFLKLSGGLLFLYSDEEKAIFANIDVADGWESVMYDDEKCRFHSEGLTEEVRARVTQCFEEYGAGYLILGDSHAMDVFNGIAPSLQEPFIWSLSAPRCRINTGLKSCYFEGLNELLRSEPDIVQKIIYHQSANSYIQSSLSGTTSRERLKARDFLSLSINHNDLDNTVTNLILLSSDVPKLWLGPRFEPHYHQRDMISYALKCDGRGLEAVEPSHLELFKSLDNEARKLSIGRVEYVSLFDLYDANDTGEVADCEQVFWSDGDHWSPQGEKHFGQKLLQSGILLKE